MSISNYHPDNEATDPKDSGVVFEDIHNDDFEVVFDQIEVFEMQEDQVDDKLISLEALILDIKENGINQEVAQALEEFKPGFLESNFGLESFTHGRSRVNLGVSLEDAEMIRKGLMAAGALAGLAIVVKIIMWIRGIFKKTDSNSEKDEETKAKNTEDKAVLDEVARESNKQLDEIKLDAKEIRDIFKNVKKKDGSGDDGFSDEMAKFIVDKDAEGLKDAILITDIRRAMTSIISPLLKDIIDDRAGYLLDDLIKPLNEMSQVFLEKITALANAVNKRENVDIESFKINLNTWKIADSAAFQAKTQNLKDKISNQSDLAGKLESEQMLKSKFSEDVFRQFKSKDILKTQDEIEARINEITEALKKDQSLSDKNYREAFKQFTTLYKDYAALLGQALQLRNSISKSLNIVNKSIADTKGSLNKVIGAVASFFRSKSK